MNFCTWKRMALACACVTTLLWQTGARTEDSDVHAERAMTLEDIANWPGAPQAGAISDDGRWFAFIQPDSQASQSGTLQIRRIGADNITSIENVATYALSGGADPAVVTHHTDGALAIRNLKTGAVSGEVKDVKQYVFDPERRMLAFVSETEARFALRVIDVRQPRNVTTLLSDAKELKALGWSRDGRALTAYQAQASGAKGNESTLLHVFRELRAAKPTRETLELAELGSRMPSMQWRADAPPQWLADGSGIVLKAQVESQTEQRDPEAPWVVVWHWKSMTNPWVESARQALGYRASDTVLYRFADRSVISLARGEFEQAIVPSRAKRWGIVLDSAPYARHGRMTGNDKVDVYAVDLRTGKRRLVLSNVKDHHFAREVWPSPDGEQLLYWRDRHYHVYELATDRSRNLTASVPVSFLDRLDDRGREEPPVPAVGFRGDANYLDWGWSRDSAYIVLHDGVDLWRISAASGKAVNLTRSQRALGAEWYERWPLVSSHSAAVDEEGIDLSQPVYVAPFNRRTKRSGIARIDVLRAKVEVLKWDDALFADWRSSTLLKAKNADVYVYRYERADQAPGFYATDANFQRASRLDGAEEDRFRAGIAWSAGSTVLEYTADNGRPLFATLYLPAGYEQGKSYPTIVEVYEQTSNGRNAFPTPDDFLASRSFYTSNGYAVLRPDLTYEINDPMVSAARYTQRALQEAIATGVVDAQRVGLIGTSFGGHETNFIVTQTDAFRAAVASAGGGSAFRYYRPGHYGVPTSSISDHNQLRMRGPFTAANADSFIRNSAILYADRVTTPLLLINNTRDTAVPWEEGLEMFNALLRHDKPVILLQYPEEGHTPPYANAANGRDRAERIKQFFDHHLKGAPAPAWIQDGVPRQHLPSYVATPK